MFLILQEHADGHHRKSLIELVQELPPALREEVRDFAQFLLARQRRELARQAEAHGWPGGSFEPVAGSISNPTFVRPPQGDAETRLPFE